MNTAWGRRGARLGAAARSASAWWRLGPAGRSLYFRAWWTLLAFRLRLGSGFPPRVVRPLAAGRVPQLPGDSQLGEAVEVEPLLAAFRPAGRTHLFNPTCLPRSLALQRFLAHHGVASELRLGMRRGARGLEGHAWVEAQGVPFDDTKRLQSYVTLEWTR